MIKPEVEYVNTTPANSDYPYGSAKESTTSTSRDGTPFGKALLNDFLGWMQAVVTAAGVVPSGEPETALASDILTSMQALFASSAQGALAETALQDAADFATAAQGALADTALQGDTDFPHLLAAKGHQELPGGYIEQWGVLTGVSLNQSWNAETFHIEFPTACLNIQCTVAMDAPISGNVAALLDRGSITTTGFSVAGDHDTSTGTGDIHWRAIGH